MTTKRLFVGRKTVEDKFTIINDYENEIGVKENRSGDVIVLKHSDLNAQQFVAQLVVFLNDQNQAIVDLYDSSKYWSDKATERIKELEKENEQLKKELDKLELVNEMLSMDFSNSEHELWRENEQLKKENNNLKKALWEAEENYLHEAYYDNPIREEDKLIDLKEDFKRGYWND